MPSFFTNMPVGYSVFTMTPREENPSSNTYVSENDSWRYLVLLSLIDITHCDKWESIGAPCVPYLEALCPVMSGCIKEKLVWNIDFQAENQVSI